PHHPLCAPARPPTRRTPSPSTTLFRSDPTEEVVGGDAQLCARDGRTKRPATGRQQDPAGPQEHPVTAGHGVRVAQRAAHRQHREDRKSTRLNSSHVKISYAVFCLKIKR